MPLDPDVVLLTVLVLLVVGVFAALAGQPAARPTLTDEERWALDIYAASGEASPCWVPYCLSNLAVRTFRPTAAGPAGESAR